MTTPLRQTPGDQREDHAQAAASAVAAVYAQCELVIIAAIATLARKVASGAMLPAIAVRHLRATVNATLSAAAPRIRQELDDAMQGAGQRATAMVTSTAERLAAPAPGQWTEPLAALLDTAGDTAAQSAEDTLTAVTAAAAKVTAEAPTEAVAAAASRLAVPPPASPYSIALDRAFGQFGGFPGQSLSFRRMQAAQAMLDDLGQQGITGFTDKAGRRWDLASYTEMATRTAVSNAWDDMQWQMGTRSGLDLVKVSTHSTEGSCPACLPWLGKTLSITGATHDYPTVAEAKAAGWRHPNCRCFATVIDGGYMEDVTNPVDIEDAAEAYKASQRQRAHERNVRKAGRAMQAAITPAAKARARRDLASARAASAAHRHRHGVVIMKVTVQRRERPFGPR